MRRPQTERDGMKKNGVIDLTHGPVLKVIFLFAIPVIIGNYLQEMYNTVDTLIVGHTLGVTKLAAVGATSSLVFMVTGFLIGNAGGCAITTSQYYGAQNMDGSLPAKTAGRNYPRYAGIALETQHYPDSPNRPDFPSTVLRPGETFRSRTEYRFSAE